MRGTLIVLSGPSGAGKGTICQKIRTMRSIKYSISATTRQPRAGEVHGREYFFLSKEDFEEMIAKGGLLEWAKVYDNYYGTPKAFVESVLDAGDDCILEIDTQGALNVKKAMPEAVLVFVAPPSLGELRNRIVGRGTESIEEIDKRMSCAETEMSFIKAYNYVIINDEVDQAVAKFDAILTAERCRVERSCQ